MNAAVVRGSRVSPLPLFLTIGCVAAQRAAIMCEVTADRAFGAERRERWMCPGDTGMRHEGSVVLLALVLLSMHATTGGHAATAAGDGAIAAAQDPAIVETALDLDRPTRRLIQQELRNEGFDPGTPDGLFGPRTRATIRDWQQSRGASPTGRRRATPRQLASLPKSTPRTPRRANTEQRPRASARTETALPPGDLGLT